MQDTKVDTLKRLQRILEGALEDCREGKARELVLGQVLWAEHSEGRLVAYQVVLDLLKGMMGREDG